MKHRPLNDQEISQQNGRIMQLEPPGEEEEDLDRDVNPKTTGMLCYISSVFFLGALSRFGFPG